MKRRRFLVGMAAAATSAAVPGCRMAPAAGESVEVSVGITLDILRDGVNVMANNPGLVPNVWYTTIAGPAELLSVWINAVPGRVVSDEPIGDGTRRQLVIEAPGSTEHPSEIIENNREFSTAPPASSDPSPLQLSAGDAHCPDGEVTLARSEAPAGIDGPGDRASRKG